MNDHADSPNNPSAEWDAAAKAEELTPTGRALVVVKGRHIAIFKTGDEVYAVDNQCPHARGPLEDGLLGEINTPEGKHRSLSCPWHHATFDLLTGQVQPDCETPDNATVFPAKLEGGMIWVKGVTPRASTPTL